MAADITHEHRDVNGGWLRPAVFGANDGLVSNFALMAGVAGGTADRTAVLVAGLAGLVAGAFSMAAGEWISVRTQAELVEAEIETERRELRLRPEAELAELTEAFVDRGVDADLAAKVAAQLSRDPEDALEIHALAELGTLPGAQPSPWVAAVSSLFAFTFGALIPLLPYVVGARTLLPAAVVSLIGLFAVGAVASRVTNRRWWFSGLRQLAIGGAAALVTYGVGTLVGS